MKQQLVPLLKNLDVDSKAHWGKMNAQQMVEHLEGALKLANGKLVLPMMNFGDSLESSRTFLLSEKPLKKNTKTALMGDEPPPFRKANMAEAITSLEKELIRFFEVFENDPKLVTINPIFGQLNFDMNVQLLYKHAIHHLQQFGLLAE
ncbi:MAG: hypothetical protein JST58_05790 [Bacteroidetes bacterium]|nr:hypothetical protein [Bacteroidota bacterium]